MVMTKKGLLAVCSLILLGCFFPAAAVYGAPAAKLWPYWQKYDPNSSTVVDHTGWDRILHRYVTTDDPSGINRFRYSSVSAADRLALKNYLRKMQGVKVTTLNRSEQEAYWINLYNALTVNIILDHYPVKSIRDIDISPGFFSNGPWDAKLLEIEGQKVSLNDIEHRILRPIWHDNRIHYAVNCASLGCPNLQPMAYTAANIDMVLDKAARDYINSPRGVSFTDGKIVVSGIYFWFKTDFGGSEKGILRHLRKYLSPGNLEKLDMHSRRMTHQYDWTLNE